MTMTAPNLNQPTALRLPLTEVFRSEIADARRRGYRVQVQPLERAVSVRLVPCTQRTIALARANNAAAAEATIPFDDPGDLLDAIRTAFAAVFQHVQDASA